MAWMPACVSTTMPASSRHSICEHVSPSLICFASLCKINDRILSSKNKLRKCALFAEFTSCLSIFNLHQSSVSKKVSAWLFAFSSLPTCPCRVNSFNYVHISNHYLKQPSWFYVSSLCAGCQSPESNWLSWETPICIQINSHFLPLLLSLYYLAINIHIIRKQKKFSLLASFSVTFLLPTLLWSLMKTAKVTEEVGGYSRYSCNSLSFIHDTSVLCLSVLLSSNSFCPHTVPPSPSPVSSPHLSILPLVLI